MKNFSYYNPVKIIFGKQTIAKLSKEIPENSKVLMIYGGGSIKKNGVYEQVTSALKEFTILEFSGIEPNPHYETCMKAVEVIRKENINFLLAVGGGSVLDATKFISAATYFEGDAWDITSKKASISKAIPLGAVLTLPATGSEMNCNGVITKVATQEKFSFSLPLTYPKFSILDPETTYSLPERQVANGIVDAFVHVMEQYLTFPQDAPLQDYFSESIVKVLVEEGSKVLTNPKDYNVRANIMWAATMALNGLIAKGVEEDWATHSIGHELTAFYGIDHGQTLAIVLPGTMSVLKKEKEAKIIQLGEQVFGIGQGTNDEKVFKTIDAVDNFFRSLGMKTKLSEYGLEKKDLEPIVKRFYERQWKLGENAIATPEKIEVILNERL
ncbi:MAG: iron-containing alcohol dehydrogenase [Prevotellaceae bacterium]|jgi:NADP-dependent alcohol dehydrogenase|nr:iron-containing alcohol dehydrogenase [Prevotellaceae bacterium]